jgi:hypothetical protein
MKRLLERVYYLNVNQTKYVSLFLAEKITPHIRIVCGNKTVVLFIHSNTPPNPAGNTNSNHVVIPTWPPWR